MSNNSKTDKIFKLLVILLLGLTGFHTYIVYKSLPDDNEQQTSPLSPGIIPHEKNGDPVVLPSPNVDFATADIKQSMAYANHLQNAFSYVADKSIPSVVIVRTAKRIKYYLYRQPPNGLFPWQYNNPGQVIQKEAPQVSGQASGFVVRKDGYIVTNYHVVKGQSDFTVLFKNEKQYPAKLVGVDPNTDLAVLKIEPEKDLPVLTFADSSKVKVGHWALAIGAPFSLNYTVTSGIVSHCGRAVGMNVYENYIQTDAAVNPGNSGGPLLNLKGEVIGINDFIFTPPNNRGSVGLSFAISSNLAKRVTEQLIEKGHVQRAWLGIAMQNLPLNQAEKLGLKDGVIIMGVKAGAPAEKAGLTKGDIITHINGSPIDDFQDITQAVIERKPGESISMTVFRNGKSSDIDVITGE